MWVPSGGGVYQILLYLLFIFYIYDVDSIIGGGKYQIFFYFIFIFYIYDIGSIIGGGEYILQLKSTSNLWSQVSLVYTQVRKYNWYKL